ncbi:MAG: MBOAT family protein [Limisphaerales bacterium]
MIFNSIEFLIFLPVVLGLHFALPHRLRWVLLLVASYYFYMCWRAEYLLLILLTTCITYATARSMDRPQATRGHRRGMLVLSLTTNLLILFVFKYFNFFASSANSAAAWLGIGYTAPLLEVLLPVGISFYTFQALSYSMDVYRREIQPESHFGIYALFVSFFPQLVAGPIERTRHLLPQLKARVAFDEKRVISGGQLILWGFFKKLVIADRLAILVNTVYNDVPSNHGPGFLLATLCFSFQIYCDFSAYSDIAIGAARMFGVDLMRNFRQPYFSRSITEFWRRWHISLSTWFRDYLYVPLGGSREGRARWCANILIVFLVSGLWHGAAWTFVIWGAIHGLLLVLEKVSGWSSISDRPGPLSLARVAATFSVVSFTWIFFRANSLEDALRIVREILMVQDWSVGEYASRTRELLGLRKYEIAVAMAGIAVLLLVDFLEETGRPLRSWLPRHRPLRWVLYAAGIVMILFFAEFGSAQFIYFQF